MDRIINQFFDIEIAHRYLPTLIDGLYITASLAILVVLSGLFVGIVLSIVRISSPLPFKIPVVIFCDLFRALPPLAILVCLYYALPFLGIQLSGFVCAWIGLALVLSAFVEEIVYGGLMAIGKGQWEAARSTGIGFFSTLLIIILPQALRMTIAPVTNRAIAISKNTALASVIAVPEVLNLATTALSESANSTPLTMAAMIYLLLFAPFVIFSRWVERRFPQRRQ